MNAIRIRGARLHNLKSVDLDLPRQQFIVITGVSGSGKSTLAFDTLHAEGRRRYMETLSTHARRLLHHLDAPPVDSIEGLSPTIAVAQGSAPRNPRSTVGVLTEIYDHLQLLFARLGVVHCPDCNIPVRAHTIAQMAREVLEWPMGSRILILAPLGRVEEKALAKTLMGLRRDGFVRARIGGKIYELDPPPLLPRQAEHTVEVVLDRIILKEDKERRLRDALEAASGLGGGLVRVIRMEGDERSFSERLRCESCGKEFTEPSPGLFSFHHPLGACPDCGGLGYRTENPVRAEETARDEDADDEDSVHGLPPGAASWTICPTCGGSRLNPQARSVRVGGAGIHQTAAFPLPELKQWFAGLELSATDAEIAAPLLREMRHRIAALEELGLSYLSLDRSLHTLSGGEAQRVRLANQLSAPLAGVIYVLDEPSVGLHHRDNERLLGILMRLRDAGNTVVVVEHDAQTILAADYLVDMGPGAGTLGGAVLFSGPPREILLHSESLTGQYLSGRKSIAITRRRKPFACGDLRIEGASGRNLKSIDVSIPLGCLVCVTGVSGSGKSTLVLDTLYRELTRRLYGAQTPAGPFRRIAGAEAIGKVLHVDQTPLGRTPRSNPATNTGIFGLIRQLFAQVPEARARGYRAGRFSFNVKGGRCEACKGEGLRRIDMAFLPDVYVSCPVCLGTRYAPDALEIRFKGANISEVLDMSVHQAAAFFENQPLLRDRLEVLREVGLGYLKLGQAATTLSGGEAQRIKLARELSRRTRAKALYILDEPTTGLHFDDIEKLLHILQRLVDAGHTVILIEHHMDVIKAADYVIDMGPEGGDGGGFVVAKGPPEEIAKVDASYTGRFLKEALKARSKSNRKASVHRL
ncbi:MAG: excinuclease ABC subunit UvrA [Syntrophobacteraceae bacterium]